MNANTKKMNLIPARHHRNANLSLLFHLLLFTIGTFGKTTRDLNPTKGPLLGNIGDDYLLSCLK